MYIYLVLLNVLWAYLNNEERLYNIKHGITQQLNHPIWTAAYTAAVVLPWLFVPGHHWQYLVVALLWHASIFAFAYNWMALGWSNAFKLSTTTTAITDVTYRYIIDWVNKKFHADFAYSIFVPFIICLVASIFLIWL